MDRKVGILLVHGIGNQRPGALAGQFSALLAKSINGSGMGTQQSAETSVGDESLLRRISSARTTIFIREANWSGISSPDMPIRIRDAGYLLSNYTRHLAGRYAEAFRRLDIAGRPWRAAAIGVFTIVATWLLEDFYFQEFSSGDQLFQAREIYWQHFYATYVALVFVLALLLSIRMAAGETRRRFERWGLESATIRACLGPLYFALAFFAAIAISVVGLSYGPIFTVMFILVLAAGLVINWLAKALAVMFNTLAGALSRLKWAWGARWVLRVGWITFGLPAYAVLSVIKAESSLISTLLSQACWRTKFVALLGTVGVYLYFLLLVLILEIPILALFIYPLMTLSGDLNGSLYTAIIFGLMGIGVAKLMLPVLDLLLDISHYHLASRGTRHEYQRSIDDAMAELLTAGCNDIYVLAHSLGTVITIDYLQANAEQRWPVRFLHTIGSPLDKFWYVDRTHKPSDGDIEVLGYPGIRWINDWTWSDPVAGHLSHFSPVEGSVKNRHIPSLFIPMYSHVMYWACGDVLHTLVSYIREPAGSHS